MKNKLQKTLCVIAMMIVSSVAQATVYTTDLGADSRQCTDYARSVVPRLPYGLYTLADKKAIINSYTCSVGAVAIIDSGIPAGHVAVVNLCASTQIKITETNWKPGRKTTRTATGSGPGSQLRILGYFKP